MALPAPLWTTTAGTVLHASIDFVNLNTNLTYLAGNIGGNIPGFGMLSTTTGAAWRTIATAAATFTGAQIGVAQPKAGSIVGLGLVSDTAIASGAMTVTVTKNGTAGTLAATLSGSATKITAVQATGIDTFLANDALSMTVSVASTTSGHVEGFLVVRYSA